MSARLVAEYARFGADEKEGSEAAPGWRLETAANQNHELCTTYPSLIAVPAAASTELVWAAAQHRSRRRLPVLSWVHPSKGTALIRGAQPCPGVLWRRSAADEEWVRLLRAASGEGSTLRIFDARSSPAAHANRLKGGGVESGSRYGPVTFLRIANVHVVKQRHQELRRAAARGGASAQHKRWLRLQMALLSGAVRIASVLDGGASVLLHCSDGWDRTPQLTCLVQLMLDAHARTPAGFAVLLEKEWCAFGHRFEFRRSREQPIFLQFLDAVGQLVELYPSAFGFRPSLLLALAAAHDDRGGPFSADCERERRPATPGEQLAMLAAEHAADGELDPAPLLAPIHAAELAVNTALLLDERLVGVPLERAASAFACCWPVARPPRSLFPPVDAMPPTVGAPSAAASDEADTDSSGGIEMRERPKV